MEADISMKTNSSSGWSPFVEPYGIMMGLMPAHLANQWKGCLDTNGDDSIYSKLEESALGYYASLKYFDDDVLIVFAGDRSPTCWRVEGEKHLIVLRVLHGADNAAQGLMMKKLNPNDRLDTRLVLQFFEK